MTGGWSDRAVKNLQQRRFAGTVRADDAESVAGADQPCHVIEDLTTGDGDLLRGGRHLRRGIVRLRTVLRWNRSRLLSCCPGRFSNRPSGCFNGLLRGRNAGIYQSRVGQIVDGDFHTAVHLRFGVHGRHHIHTGSRGFHFRHIGVDVGLAVDMLENLRHIDQIDHLLA